jgi:hypothetical protein
MLIDSVDTSEQVAHPPFVLNTISIDRSPAKTIHKFLKGFYKVPGSLVFKTIQLSLKDEVGELTWIQDRKSDGVDHQFDLQAFSFFAIPLFR